MKWLHIAFEDEEYEQLKRKKGKRSWRKYILELASVQSQQQEFSLSK
jgi:predicted CopG family antitoxin